MPAFPPFLARIARFTLLLVVGFLLLWLAAWKGWILRSDRQVLPRHAHAGDIQVPPGYKVEALAAGLNAPSALEIAPDGTIYIAESGYGGAYAATAGVEGATPGRIIRLERDGSRTVVAGGFAPPLAGFVHDRLGSLYVSHAGAISLVDRGGQRRDVLTGLPSLGDHKNNNIALGPDGKLYLTQGTATNSGIMGLDNWLLWGRQFPAGRDIPCREITLRGVNVETADPRSLLPMSRVATGAFSPFGQSTRPGQKVRGELPCNGAIMRMNTDGSGLELVAWGMRNPFDLRFGPDTQLYVTDNGFDTRGSRPVESTDLLYQVKPGAWYGWPDYWNGQSVAELPTAGREKAQPLLATLPAKPERAYASFAEHTATEGFDFAPPTFGFGGQMFLAQFGTAFPATSQDPALAGFRVVRYDPATRRTETFASNKRPGPASLIAGQGGFERPVAVRFGPDGAMYVLDWGHLAVTRNGPFHVPYSGVLWRIAPQSPAAVRGT